MHVYSFLLLQSKLKYVQILADTHFKPVSFSKLLPQHELPVKGVFLMQAGY